jgi:hypothetical protein
VCGSSGILAECNDLHDFPVDAVGEEEVSIEFGDIADFVDLEFEEGVEVVHERLDEELFVMIVYFTESFAKQPEKLLVNTLHHAALEDHVNQFALVPLRDIHLNDLMRTLLEIDGRLYGQVDGPAEVDEILFREITDALFAFLLLISLYFLLIVRNLFKVDDVLFSENL